MEVLLRLGVLERLCTKKIMGTDLEFLQPISRCKEL